MSAELGGAETGLLVIDHRQRTPHRSHRSSPVATGQPGDPLRLPGRQPLGRCASPPSRAGPVELGGTRVEIASRQPQAPRHGVSHDGAVSEPHLVQVSSRPRRQRRQRGVVISLGQAGPGDGCLRQRLPPGPPLDLEQLGRLFGPRPGGQGVVGQERDVSEQDEAFGQI